MKIVHIISSLQRGGAEMALANLLRELKNSAHHSVIFFHDGPVRQTIEELGIPCYQIKARGSYANPLFFLRLLKLIKKIAPDCIHTDLWAANLLGRLCAQILGIRCVSVVHAMTEHEGKLRATIDRFFPATPTTYVAVSQQVQESLQKNKRLRKAPCVVVHNGVDAHAMRIHAGAPIPEKKPTTLIIGAVGRLIAEKNYALLLHSFAQLATRYQNINLYIIGSGQEEATLKALTQTLHIADRITWAGNQLAHPYYAFFDIFVQPSRSEGLSIALLEALAASLPVIVTGKNNTHAVIQDRSNGRVVEPDNLPAFTTALAELIENAALRAAYGAAGFATVNEKFSLQKTAQEYLKLFNNIRSC